AERQKLFGFAAIDSEAMVEHRRIEEYQPLYKFGVGLGAARIPNITGNHRDAARFALQVRAVERFHQRRSEFGLMLDFHMTRRTAEKQLADGKNSTSESTPAADGELQPYPTSTSLFAIYNR